MKSLLSHLLCLEKELAAGIRQFARAMGTNDDAAIALEIETVAERVKSLLFIHLEIRIGMGSDSWVWLDGQEGFEMEVTGCETNLSGRIWCTLPTAGPRREWTEPVAGLIMHSAKGRGLSGYSFSFGTRATLLDLPTVERLLAGGKDVAPPAPTSQDEWAYVFRIDDRREDMRY